MVDLMIRMWGIIVFISATIFLSIFIIGYYIVMAVFWIAYKYNTRYKDYKESNKYASNR